MTAPIRVKTKLSQLFSLICFVHFNAYQDSKNMTFRKKNYGISWRKLVSPMVACNNQQASPLHETNIGGWQAQEDTTMKLIYFDAIMKELWTYKMKCIPSTTSIRRELVRKLQPSKEFKKMKIWCPVKESYHRTISDELQVAQ